MWFSQFRNLVHACRCDRRPKPGRRRARLALEQLDERVVPTTLQGSTITVAVKGHAEWTNGGITRPIPYAAVRLSQQNGGNGPFLAVAQTNANGDYQAFVTFDPTQGFPRVWPVIMALSVYDKVESIRDGPTIAVSIPQGQVLTASAVQELPTAVATGYAAAAFSAYSAVVQAGQYMDYLDFHPPQAEVIVNSAVETEQPDQTAILHINSAEAFDWDAVDHEYGHYVEFVEGFGYVNQGHDHSFGTHNPGGVTEAFDEGWADYFAVVAQQREASLPYAFHRGSKNSWFVETNSKKSFSANLAWAGIGQDDELSVAGALYHISHGDMGLYVTDKTIFEELKANHATTIGEAWDAIATPLSDQKRTLLGAILGYEHIAPTEISPADGATTKPNSAPTFRWNTNGVGRQKGKLYYLDQFQLTLYTSNFSPAKTIPVSDKTGKYKLNKTTATFTPSQDIWNAITNYAITNGNSELEWVVEGKRVSGDPYTPGTLPPLDYYLSGARAIHIAQTSSPGSGRGTGGGHP
jgi:hypothetical protein